MSPVSGNPDALEHYSTAMQGTFANIDGAISAYASAVNSYNSAPSGGNTCMISRDGAATGSTAALRDLDREPAAFAYALRQLDHLVLPGGTFSIADTAMFDALAQARYDHPDWSDSKLRGEAVLRQLKTMLDKVGGISEKDLMLALVPATSPTGTTTSTTTPGSFDPKTGRFMLGSELPDSIRKLNINPSDVQRLMNELDAHKNDAEFMQQVFSGLNGNEAARVPVIFSAVGFHELGTREGRTTADLPFRPNDWAKSYSNFLGNASRQTGADGAPLLGKGFWDQLFSAPNWKRHTDGGLFGTDHDYIKDSFSTLFISGTFDKVTAERAGKLGLLAADGKLKVEGRHSFFYGGPEDRIGAFLSATARTPEAAANLLASNGPIKDESFGKTSTNKTPAQVLTDLNYRGMDKHLLSVYYGNLIQAGTIQAEYDADANHDGTLTDEEGKKVLSAWTASANIFNATARNHDNTKAFDPAINNVLRALALSFQDHMLTLGQNFDGTDNIHVFGGQPVSLLPNGSPSSGHGLSFDSKTLREYFAVVMRNPDDRVKLLTQSAVLEREMLANALANPDARGEMAHQIGRLRGEMLAGGYEANNVNSQVKAAEIAASNKAISTAFAIGNFAFDKGLDTLAVAQPEVGVPLKSAVEIARMLGVTDGLLDAAKGDPKNPIAEALKSNQDILDVEGGANRNLLLDAALLNLQRELNTNPDHLSYVSGYLRDQINLPPGSTIDLSTDQGVKELRGLSNGDVYKRLGQHLVDSPTPRDSPNPANPFPELYDSISNAGHNVGADPNRGNP